MTKTAQPLQLPFQMPMFPGETLRWVYIHETGIPVVFTLPVTMPLGIALVSLLTNPAVAAGNWSTALVSTLQMAGFMLVIALPVALVMGLIMFLTGKQWRKIVLANYAYALTNQRLIYHDGKQLTTRSLLELSEIDITRGRHGTGTITFGGVLPPFKDTPLVEQVHRLILEQQEFLQNEDAYG